MTPKDGPICRSSTRPSRSILVSGSERQLPCPEKELDRRAGGSPRAPSDPETELRGASGLLSASQPARPPTARPRAGFMVGSHRLRVRPRAHVRLSRRKALSLACATVGQLTQPCRSADVVLLRGTQYLLSVLCSRIRENSGDQKVSGHFGPKSHDFGYTCCLQFLATVAHVACPSLPRRVQASMRYCSHTSLGLIGNHTS